MLHELYQMVDTTSTTCFNTETSRLSLGELCLVKICVSTAQLLVEKGLDMNDTLHTGTTVYAGILNDDVLLSIFDFCRLTDEEKNGANDFRFGVDSTFNDQNLDGKWDRQRWWHGCWWHKLTQVCQGWRSLILASPSRLNLHVICAKDTPAADMLAHFPHLPLVVVYKFEQGERLKHKQNILLSLQHRHRLRSIHLNAKTTALQKMAIPWDEEFPLLVSLTIISEDISASTAFTLPKSFRAPNLRNLILRNVIIQTGTPILATSIPLTILILERIPTSAHIPPEYLVDLLELMPQLVILSVGFPLPTRGRGVSTHTPPSQAQKKFITLRCLERLHFMGTSYYLEDLIARINAPVLELFYIYIFYQRSFGILPNISRSLNTTVEFRSRIVAMDFHQYLVSIEMGDTRPNIGYKFPFQVCVRGNLWQRSRDSDWRLASVSQICSAIAPVFSVTEELILGDIDHGIPWETQSNDIRVNWHNILRQFSHVKTLMVSGGLVEELSLHLQPDGDEALVLGLLPKLERIVVPRDFDVGNAFAAFIDSRRFAGHPVYLLHDIVPTRGWQDLYWLF
jgi:hypothetical protein